MVLYKVGLISSSSFNDPSVCVRPSADSKLSSNDCFSRANKACGDSSDFRLMLKQSFNSDPDFSRLWYKRIFSHTSLRLAESRVISFLGINGQKFAT